jgi:hypothetical protein
MTGPAVGEHITWQPAHGSLRGGLGLLPLTVLEVRRLLVALVWATPVEPGLVLAWSRWRRRHQARAGRAPYRQREQRVRLEEGSWRSSPCGWHGVPAGGHAGIRPRSGHLAQQASGHVVDEAAHRLTPGHKRVRLDPTDRLAHVLLQVRERLQGKCGRRPGSLSIARLTSSSVKVSIPQSV